MEQLSRYPGAGPFKDDEVSRQTFFGRKKETEELAGRIQIHRVTIVYGRSGLGKSSLLNAGVAPKLRENGYLPVFIRLNSMDKSLFETISSHVSAEAERQNIEHIQGEGSSLWVYFKSNELWLEDQLLTPVVVIDQFEELFFLSDEKKQEEIINELSMIVRGVPPKSTIKVQQHLHAKYGSKKPAVQFVFAIREDFLGYLEDVADEIPQIFDCRFRVTPMTQNAACEALEGPATIENEKLASKPFKIESELIKEVMRFLKDTGKTRALRKKELIEPFQLQLICKHIDEIAAQKSSSESNVTTVSFSDIGGQVGLISALSDFYKSALDSISSKKIRKKVNKVCINHLISMDGKRLSIEENEFREKLGLSKNTIETLVNSRLLRKERRADTHYYEISHDALVNPIISSQKNLSKSIFYFSQFFYITMFIYLVLCFLFVIFVLIQTLFFPDADAKLNSEELIGLIVVGPLLILPIKYFFKKTKNNYQYYSRERVFRSNKTKLLKDQSIPLVRIPTAIILLTLSVLTAMFAILMPFIEFATWDGLIKKVIYITYTIPVSVFSLKFSFYSLKLGFRKLFGYKHLPNSRILISSKFISMLILSTYAIVPLFSLIAFTITYLSPYQILCEESNLSSSLEHALRAVLDFKVSSCGQVGKANILSFFFYMNWAITGLIGLSFHLKYKHKDKPPLTSSVDRVPR